MSIQAAIYVRVSTEAQGAEDKASLPTQIESCKSYSLLHGVVVDDGHVYEEKHSVRNGVTDQCCKGCLKQPHAVSSKH
jgi:DNA invertase Pin-like site-specific DNA recombinase